MSDIDAAELGADPSKKPEAKPDAPAQNFGVEVEIAGKKYMVTSEMANAINAEKANQKGEIERQLQNLGRKIEDVASTSLRREKPAESKKEPSDDDFWANPAEFFKALRSDILGQVEEKVKGVKSELTNAYTADRSTESFWNSFYDDNKDLKEDKFIVDAVMKRDWDEIKDMKAGEAKKILADRARQTLLKYTKTEQPGSQPKVEGVGGKKASADRDEPAKVTSLSDIIKSRREARRKTRKAG